MHPDGDVQVMKKDLSAGVKPCPFVSAKYHVHCISMMSSGARVKTSCSNKRE